MAKAKKLPSGSWRVQVYDYTDAQGKRHYKSFTVDDPSAAGRREAERLAATWAVQKKMESNPSTMTLKAAFSSYIESREAILSPATIREYKRSAKTDLQELMPIKICDLTQETIQQAINHEALTHSPKSVRNMHGLLSAVLQAYRPAFALRTSLPQKERPALYIPSDDEVRRIIDCTSGTVMELPILLAAFGPMRRGEICALDSRDISGNIVHVCRNMVRDSSGKWVIKKPKSYAGDRYIDFPDFVAKKWNGITGKIVPLNPANISDRFSVILKHAGVPHFRFHDLRHYSASIQHALGIPDAYIMQRGGWGSDPILKAVYRHALDDKTVEMTEIANHHFSELCNTEYNTRHQ